ncbi:hypothetical protein [Cellulosimicrobium arenosum]|uniref:Uncharacterized protein n=1 Tax=Cellulosimicrobium arenosum TaxID=2708133 RepID=A0A927J123_9MICO|nr:hypothetical protein [Cellulosimicrobium arenosum]MBD8079916.1 hypothetical protein [Cellulosimicrobium arenosum]
MTDMTANVFHSTANPRRTTLISVSAAEAAAPQREAAAGLTMVGGDAGTCADGTCALPD